MGAGLQLTARRRDGAEFPVDVSLPHSGTGDDVLVIAAVRDVTEARKAAENARSLAAAEKLVRTVMASASMGIALAHMDGSFRVVNRSLCDLLGYDSEPAPARPPGISVPRVGVQGRISPRSG